MASENKQTKNLHERAILLIKESRLLSSAKKKDLLLRIKDFSESQLMTLITALEKEAEVITKGLKNTFQKLVKEGDKVGIKESEKVIHTLRRAKHKFDEQKSANEEKKYLSILEQQINKL